MTVQTIPIGFGMWFEKSVECLVTVETKAFIDFFHMKANDKGVEP